MSGGAAFPFGNSIKQVIGDKNRRNSIKTSLELIITTPKGSVPYNPELGSTVPYLVFEKMNTAIENLLSFYIVNDIETQDSRIKITSISVYKEDKILNIMVGYRDRNDENKRTYQTPVSFNLE